MGCKSQTRWDIENCDGEAILDAVVDNHLEQVQAGLGVGWTIDVTVGADIGNSVLVELEVFDAEGNPLEEVKRLIAWLADGNGGPNPPTTTAPDGDVAIAAGVGTILIEHTTDIYFEFLTDVNGELDLDIGEAGAATWYLNVVQGDGTVYISPVIEFTL